MVSSFDSLVLQEFQRLNTQNNTDVRHMYLHNYYEHFELPAPEIYSWQGDGINISSTKMTREVI